MYGKIYSACVNGIDGQMIQVEIDLSNGLPQIHMVGLPDSAVRESIDRVRSAIKNCGFTFPLERITVNLAPANLRKEGSAFDLAIALGILQTSGQVPALDTERTLVIGELALDGSLRGVPGVLSMVYSAKHAGFTRIILPADNAEEARLIQEIDIIPLERLQEIHNLKDVSAFRTFLKQTKHSASQHESHTAPMAGQSVLMNEDYDDVIGQYHAKRALMIAAAGMHNILLIGPPGSGKTMLLRRLPSILPPLQDAEALEVTKIYSVAGILQDRAQLIRRRPFRAPHHTTSSSGLIGGGSIPKPGEASLAHRGILFLDELPEFSRGVLEAMRQPLEDRNVTIARAKGTSTFPAHFLLAGAMNPCPCGYLGAETEANPCTCSLPRILSYRAKISGPLLDRIDLHVEVPRVEFQELKLQPMQQTGTLSTARMAETVRNAQQMQNERYLGTSILFNSDLAGKNLRRFCRLPHEAETLLQHCFETLGLSVRSHDRILKIARTIADLEHSNKIETRHLAEAIQYRTLDQKLTKKI